ncbi:hypothetical protein BDN71DRAFT_762422 [Pleurotus eryngii]|uniref:Uncharacterized protein n=1 Tax=Pleurotus eryngii TaxID=5323 RepID=A0A9P6A149_PLEER|nr:hypothetical protein BDN71DRAFT_762422 [Pleurotus eryngii]
MSSQLQTIKSRLIPLRSFRCEDQHRESCRSRRVLAPPVHHLSAAALHVEDLREEKLLSIAVLLFYLVMFYSARFVPFLILATKAAHSLCYIVFRRAHSRYDAIDFHYTRRFRYVFLMLTQQLAIMWLFVSVRRFLVL